ncbi:hypothetical protein [Luteibacter yeojuensis]|uniref:Uncharacterized protein n=1 Tax=Luteibacter yeojuensis TaxID=345309 RepID=A0A0F3KFQ1_9GAMM|nr:hypothetical protein [Luteibacter yeojuensis]KJV30033.1 hypothetical protein VI08_15335 [Luteibacter yeojuensis]
MDIFRSEEGLEFVIGYSYSEITREYLSEVRVYRLGDDQRFVLPRFSTLAVPDLEARVHSAQQFDIEANKWRTAQDFRTARLYSKASGRVEENRLKLGDSIPRHLTVQAPPAHGPHLQTAVHWDESKDQWALVPDFSSTPLWQKDGAHLAPSLAVGEPIPPELTPVRPPLELLNAGGVIHWHEDSKVWRRVP